MSENTSIYTHALNRKWSHTFEFNVHTVCMRLILGNVMHPCCYCNFYILSKVWATHSTHINDGDFLVHEHILALLSQTSFMTTCCILLYLFHVYLKVAKTLLYSCIFCMCTAVLASKYGSQPNSILSPYPCMNSLLVPKWWYLCSSFGWCQIN